MNRAARFARQLLLLSDVIRQPGLSPAQLARRVGISERTLRRDLVALRQLGYPVVFDDGYQLQESLAFEGTSGARGLAAVWEYQLRLMRERVPVRLSHQVEADVEALAPAALAGLLADTINRRLKSQSVR